MQGWDQQAGRFERALAKLREALRRGPEGLSVEGTHADLFRQLQPMDFGPELSRLQRGFTGRDWVVAAVEEWLSDPDGAPAFLLTGDPGAGKSAVMAHLARQLPQVAALHFCRADNSQTLRADAFVRSVAAQLATQLLSFAEALRGVLTQPNALDEEPDALFKNLIINPLATAPTGDGPLLLLVDGLDEAVQRGAQTGPSIPRLVGSFLGELATMTGRVRLVLSSRPVPGVLRHVQGRSNPFALQASAPDNRADLEAFVSGRLERIRGALKKAGTGAQAVTAWLTGRAGGNFLYAEQALLGIESGRLDPSDPDAFPAGLVGLYASQFERLFPGPNGATSYDTEWRPLLSVLVAAREPLTAEQVADALGAAGQADAAGLDPMDPAFTVRRRMKQVAAQYPEREGRYVPFHASVTEWLSGDTGHAATDAMTYAVSLKAGHRMLAAAGQAAWNNDGADSPPYALRHLPGHLLDAGQWKEAYDLLTTLAYVEAKAQAGYVGDLAEDFRAAAEAAPSSRRAEARILRVLGRALEYEIRFLRRHPECLFQVCWNRGWWTDADPAGRFFKVKESAKTNYQPPWERTEPKVSTLLEQWHQGRTKTPWVRRIIPPLDLFSSRQTVMRGHEGGAIHVAWSPAGEHVASASLGGSIRVWDLTGQADPQILVRHKSMVSRVAWSPSGEHIASAAATVRIWKHRGQATPVVVREHDEPITHFAWSPSGERFASASQDGTVLVWDPIGQADPLVLQGHEQRVNHLAWAPSEDRLASASWDGTVRVWNPTEREDPLVLSSKEGSFDRVAWSPSGERLAATSFSNLHIWTLPGQFESAVLDVGPFSSHVAWSPSSELLAAVSLDCTIRIWDPTGAAAPFAFCGHDEPITHFAWSPSGERLASASKDRTVCVWDLSGKVDPIVLRGHTVGASQIAWSPSGERLASASKDGTVRIWDATDQTDPVSPHDYLTGVTGFAWSPSGERFSSASQDGKVLVWDLVGQADPLVLRGHQDWVWHVAWSPSGERLASASRDRTIRIWDPTGAVDPLVLRGHESLVDHVAWSPSGERLASKSLDGTVRVWDPQTGAQLDSFEDRTIPESFCRASDTLSTYVCRTLPDETRIEHRRDEAAAAWFEVSGYKGLVQAPGNASVWAARTGSSVLTFRLEDTPD
jgi:WD40 repeat protein